MSNVRLIARLDIKGPNLVKGVQMEGLRVIGNTQEFASQYYKDGIDEIIYIDIVASLYGRNNLSEIVKRTSQDVFIPITVGGGIRTVEDVRKLLRAGADKVAINTASVKRPDLIRDVSRCFGSQCTVLSIQAKKLGKCKWEVYTDNGRERTGIDVLEWAIQGTELGAGEILLTSVDREGTKKGFDVDLVSTVSKAVHVPVIACGGMGNMEHLIKVVQDGNADAVAMASVLHCDLLNIKGIRAFALKNNMTVRKL
jgi:cyclase